MSSNLSSVDDGIRFAMGYPGEDMSVMEKETPYHGRFHVIRQPYVDGYIERGYIVRAEITWKPEVTRHDR